MKFLINLIDLISKRSLERASLISKKIPISNVPILGFGSFGHFLQLTQSIGRVGQLSNQLNQDSIAEIRLIRNFSRP